MNMYSYYTGVFFGIVAILLMLTPYFVVSKVISRILVKYLKNKREYRNMQEDEMKYAINSDYIWVYFLSYLLIVVVITIPCLIKILELFLH